FFSSRRRHTRSDRDWSSDVCSSDLSAGIEHNYEGWIVKVKGGDELVGIVQSDTADELQLRIAGGIVTPLKKSNIVSRRAQKESRSEERRVGKECRCEWARDD